MGILNLGNGMKLYRFLNPAGDGLYQDRFWHAVGLPYVGEDIPFHQPPVYEDVRGWRFDDADKYFCAFESPDQLVSWFRDVNPLNVFIEGGSFIEITIDPEYVLFGRHQCTYRKFKELAIRNIDVDEFIDLIAPAVECKDDILCW